MMILAAYTLKNIWFYAPAMLLSVTAIFRIISWAAHDATFATQFIIIEISFQEKGVYNKKNFF